MHVFAAAAQAIRLGRPAALATVILAGGSTPRSAGARMLIYADGDSVGTIGGGTVEHRVMALAQQVIVSGRPQRFAAHLTQDLGMCCGGQMEVYVEPLAVREQLTLFGAGHVAAAVVPLALALDFAVTVVDAREELLTEARFPDCTRLLTDPRAHARQLAGSDHSYWLILTHDHQLDQDLGEILLPQSFAWLGMIGSKAKIAKFLVRYRAAGVDPALFQRLSAPVGLDLGAETPAEIAVSIAAELVRVRRHAHRPPLPLSEIPLAARGGDGRATAPGLHPAAQTEG